MRRAGDEEISLGVRIDGADVAMRAIEMLNARIQQMNQGTGGGGMASTPVPSGTGQGSSLSTNVPGGAPPPTGILGPTVYAGGGNAMAPGALAPNTLSPQGGVPYSGQGGGATVIAGNVTVVQQGGTALPNGGGMPQSPYPGWTPFGSNLFSEQVYSNLGGMGLMGSMGARFLQQNPIGRMLFGGLSSIEQFLPAGMASGLASGISAAAFPSAVIGGIASTVATGMQFYNANNLPWQQYQTNLMARERMGAFYDPISQRRDLALTDLQTTENTWETIRSTPLGWAGRIGSFGIADAWYAGVMQPAWQRRRAFVEADAQYEQAMRSMRLATGQNMVSPEESSLRSQVQAGDEDAVLPFWRRNTFYTGPTPLRGADLEAARTRLTTLTRNRGAQSALASALGPFAVGARSGIESFPFEALGLGDYTPEQIADSFSVIPQTLMRQGNESLARRGLLEAYNPPRAGLMMGMLPDVRRNLVFHGDMESISRATALYQAEYGSGSLAMQRQDLFSALRMREIQTSIGISQFGISQTQSNIGYMQATGSSYQAIAGRQYGMGGQYDPVIAGLQQQYAAAPNDFERARISAAIEQARAGQAGARYGAWQTFYGGEQSVISTASMQAGTSLRYAMYGGGPEVGIYSAMQAQQGAAQRQAGLLERMSNNPIFAPHVREMYRAQARAAQSEADISIPREAWSTWAGIRSSEIGISGSYAASAMTGAQLFGGIGDVEQAGYGMASVTRQQLGLVQYRLANAGAARLSPQEINSLRSEEIDLMRRLNEQIEQTRRTFMTAGVAVAQFGTMVAQSQGGIAMSFFGVGGGEAAGMNTRTMNAARGQLAAAEAAYSEVAHLPDDNPYKMEKMQAVIQARTGLESTRQGYAALPNSVGLVREQMAGQFQLGVMSRTYAGWGDIRGVTMSLMQNAGARGKELGQQQRQALQDLESDPTLTPQEKEQRKSVLLRDFEGRRYALGNEMIGYQQTLEQGWMDRLISQTYNMPSRGAFVMSQFSRREAAPFMQALSSAFGFSGEGAEGARDHFLFRGGRIADSVMGVVQRPEGFMATAIGGGSRPPGTGVLAPGGGKVEATARALVEALMESLGGGGRGRMGQDVPMGRGSTSRHAADVQATRQVTTPNHAEQTSRQ